MSLTNDWLSATISTHRLPVTALLFHSSSAILSGEGSLLCIYSSTAARATFQIFESNAIHGIVEVSRTDDPTLLIYGGRAVRFVHLRHGDQGWIIRLGKLVELDDWILDAAVPIEPPPGHCIALITAHNALWKLSRDDLASDEVCVVPGSNTILYSAHSQWLETDRILIAAGTAFGDVILWSHNRHGSMVHYSFSAHEGSLFGIRISETISQHDFTRLLATSSDDRTVRVWDISDLPNHDHPHSHSRETGFGAKQATDNPRPHLLSKVMGHQSRIWMVRFRQETNGHITVQSFGEDATMIIWQLTTELFKEVLQPMNRINTLQLHSGKHIWTVATQDHQLATGGADGAIAIVDLTRHLTTQTVGTFITPGSKDHLKAYSLLDSNRLFAVSQQGMIQVVHLDSEDHMLFQQSEPKLAKYSVVTSTDGLAFACGSGQGLFVFDAGSGSLEVLPTDTAKTVALFSSSSTMPASRIYVVVRITVEACIQLVIVSKSPGSSKVLFNATSALPADIAITSFALIELTDMICTAVIGSRSGDLINFKIDYGGNADAEPVFSGRFRGHTDAVSSMQWLSPGYVFTVSRDGSQAIFRSCDESFRKIHQLRLPFGPNIEGLQIIDNKELVTWGFRNTSFVVYSVTKQLELMAIYCGGGHRVWSCLPSLHGGRLVWNKVSQTHTIEQQTLPVQTIKTGGHGREIKTIAVTHCHDNSIIIATGAEDTCIRLYRIATTDQEDINCIQVIRKHVTGPQQLSFSSSGKHLFSSGGFEEFFVWKIEHNCPLVDLGVVLESEHPHSGKSDLRITSFIVDEESRRNNALEVYMCYSDSRVALWTYNTGLWQELVAVDYLTACPTAILSFINAKVERRFVTTATDGHITLWRNDSRLPTSQRIDWKSRYQVHQSSIMSSAYLTLPDGSVVLLTGGDDNAITLTRLSSELSELAHLRVTKAHAAAVTALAVTDTVQQGHVIQSTVLSVGLDQRLVVWRLIIDISQDGMAGVRLQKARVVITNVADCCGIELLTHKEPNGIRAVIAGIGMEVIKIDAV